MTVNSIITDRPSASVPELEVDAVDLEPGDALDHRADRRRLGRRYVAVPLRCALLTAPATAGPGDRVHRSGRLGWVLAAATAEVGTRGGSLTRWIHWTPAQLDSTKQTPTAAMPMPERDPLGQALAEQQDQQRTTPP